MLDDTLFGGAICDLGMFDAPSDEKPLSMNEGVSPTTGQYLFCMAFFKETLQGDCMVNDWRRDLVESPTDTRDCRYVSKIKL